MIQIEKDLLDTFQARLITNLDEAAQAAERGFDGRFAETAAIVHGYWLAIAPEYGEQRGEARASRHRSRLRAALAAAGAAADRAGFEAARKRVEADLEGFTAAPLTPDEQVNRASQLTRFLDLVPKEYDKGTADGRVTIPFEVQEAVAFMDGVEAAFSDLEPVLLDRDPAAVERIKANFAELREDVDNAQQSVAVAPQEELDEARDRAAETLRADRATGVDRTERRSRLRTRRHLPRPARSGGWSRPLPGGRAGAARRLRLLRVRARS